MHARRACALPHTLQVVETCTRTASAMATLAPQQPMDSAILESVDGEVFPVAKAQKQARRMFLFGFAFLPFLWLMNVWLFWPDFRSPHGDVVVRKYTRHSAWALLASSLLFFPWFFFYVSAGARVMNPDLYNKIDTFRFPLGDFVPSGGN